MKKIYWIITIILIIIIGIIIGISLVQRNKPVKEIIKNDSVKSDNTNLCQEVISISEVKDTCNSGIKEDINDSYYITPKNTTINSAGTRVELSEGEISRCFKKIVTNDYEESISPEPKGSELNIMISILNSTDSANKFYEGTVPSFNESNSWEKASKNALVLNENTSEFGIRGNIAAFKAMDAFIPEYNMTAHLSKVVGITFLKGNKVIWLQSASYNQSTPLLCELENLKQIAQIIDKKIK